jgi:glycosyltransferase involved in cell wall biosynthesis
VNILHISNDFGGTEVYRNLYQQLDKLGVKQIVFVPLNPRVLNHKGNFDFVFETEGSKIIYSITQKWYHKYLYDFKISTVVKDLEKLVNLNEISLIHTNTLCMTGAVAFEISKKIKKPYLVSVRNTDINVYFKKMFWKKKYFYQILLNSFSVIFISPQYKKKCIDHYFDQSILSKVLSKIKVIPNAVDAYYLLNRVTLNKEIHNPIRIIFAGGFTENKNLLRLINAVEILKYNNYNIILTAIGLSLPNRKVSRSYIDLLYKTLVGKDYIYLIDYMDKVALCEMYKNSDIFVMPSIHETFGLSYIEALSQGLPIVYTKGEGLDGFYNDGEVGYSVDALNTEDIARGIENTIQNYDNLSKNIMNLQLSNNFDWSKIAKDYYALYNTIINSTDNI